MAIRYLKILLVLFIAFFCLAYASQNLANLESAYGAFAYVMGMTGHEAYTATFATPIQHPALIWAALILVVSCEYLAGLMATKGAWDMWKSRNSSPDQFNSAKTFALLGCGMGIVIWMGFFGAVGGALFQMWQTEAGALSLEGAFQYSVSCAIVYLITSMTDF
jgi:predicted small integral membrane protein